MILKPQIYLHLIELKCKKYKYYTQIFRNFKHFKFKNNIFRKTILSNTIKKSKEYISKHYDLGNEFFSMHGLIKLLHILVEFLNSPDQEIRKSAN